MKRLKNCEEPYASMQIVCIPLEFLRVVKIRGKKHLRQDIENDPIIKRSNG